METVYKLQKLAYAFTKAADQTLKNNELLTFTQFFILLAIHNNPTISQREIAQYLGVSQVIVTRHIEILLNKHYVIKTENEKDRRDHLLHMTHQGKDIFSTAIGILTEQFDSIFSILLKSNQTKLNRTLDLLLDNMKEYIALENTPYTTLS